MQFSESGNRFIKGTTGHLHYEVVNRTALSDIPSSSSSVTDGINSVFETGPCDKGSDESIISLLLAESATKKEIRHISSVTHVPFCVALMSEPKAQTFKFLCTWTALQTVLHQP